MRGTWETLAQDLGLATDTAATARAAHVWYMQLRAA